MIATFKGRLPDPASQLGDTLIEVLVGALALAFIVVGTLTGLNSANRATSIDRDRSQADALAQQEEDQLRSAPLAKLSELSTTHEVVMHEVIASGTKYTISSTAQYISDRTATASCTSTTPQANYIQTTSKVTWASLGKGKPVVESSIISPPPDSAMIVQVLNQSGEAVPSMNVEATGPSNTSAETSSNGCAVLGVLPGEYALNVNRTSYVDENGYANSDEDPLYNTPFYVVAETSVKKGYKFAPAGTVEVSFQNSVTKTAETGDTFVIANTGMNPSMRTFGTAGTYSASVSTGATVFPFTNSYSVYAGSCEQNNPIALGASNPEATPVTALGGKSVAATVGTPPVRIQVMSGTEAGAAKEGTAVEGAKVKITDTGCTVTRTLTTVTKGALSHPGLPYGKYTMCVEKPSSGKYWEGTFENNTVNGPSPENWTTDGVNAVTKAAIIYLGTSPSGSPPKTKSGTCP